MTDQPLFTEPMPAAQPLPARQDAVMRLLLSHLPEGITADEAGAVVHADQGKHGADERCTWCSQDGKQVLRALHRKSLVTGRRDGWWTTPGPRAKREHEQARADATGSSAPPAGSCSGSGLPYNQLPEGF